MRIFLHNFKCYAGDHTYTIEDTGLTLIEGESGAGKSTLLEAICFALTGDISKPVSYGEDSCKVIFTFEHLEITRSHRPNVVRVIDMRDQQAYDGAEAEAIIQRHFGYAFMNTSYVPQFTYKTFLYASPAERLVILETLLFENSIELLPAELKKLCTDRIRYLTGELDVTRGKLQVLENQVATAPANVADALEPSATDDQLRRRMLFLFNKQRLYDSCVQKINLLRSEISQLELKCNPVAERTFKWTRDSLEKHLMALTALERINWRKFLEFSEAECEEEIQNLKYYISELEEYNSLAQKLQQLGYNPTTIQELETKIAELEKTVETRYSCPSCSSALALVNNNLVLDTNNAPAIPAAEKRAKLAKLHQQLQEQVNLRMRHEELTTRLNSLDIEDTDLTLLKDQLGKWQTYKTNAHQISALSHHLCDADLDLQTARNELAQLIDYEKSIQLFNETSSARAFAQQQLDALCKQMEEQSLVDARAELAQLEQQVSSHALSTRLYDERLRYERTCAELRQQKEYLKLVNERREATQKLKTIISTAELEFIQQSLFTIEHLVNTLCEAVFVSDALIVRLNLFTENKLSGALKPHLEIDIYYKNRKCAYSGLSGGEQARLNVCFMVALATFFKSKLLLLDECTAQLDQEASESVFMLLKEHAPCKVVVVAHQVSQGGFDNIIHL